MADFKDILGHEEIIKHLQNAISMNKVSHSYIISGEDGLGLPDVLALGAAT